ncbi:MalY/PatB family protein [Candidatus Enterococcus ferrettii]|uniref:cysteine-S-conjugate beta-lyase n=1 Tax=Candidatus Enterococcus ferrettii TaxID=2815324 RepID=A0ABV0ERY9_9ENTE|nr:MalY/PatB family protein [Enterococcus sp. 665A]MBO1338889.1 pyridoxal phosphate-dependent aminotransferase [Enterococcus sp. 665A]
MYDFDHFISRKGKGSMKWERMYDIVKDLPEDVLPLSVADMEFKCAPEIIDGLKETLTDLPVLGYSIPTSSYYSAVTKWMSEKHAWEIDKEWIIPETGVIPALFTSVHAYTNTDDSVLIMTPVYYPFYNAVKRTNRKLVTSSLTYNGTRYEIDFEDFERKAQDPSTKLFILCSPHNPVGRVWEKQELEKVARICLDNNVIIVSDEIHFDLVMPGYQHHVLNTLSEEIAMNTIVCTAPSKTFNLAGMHTCNIVIQNQDLRKKYQNKLLSQGHMGLNILGIQACELAYTKAEHWYDALLKQLNQNKEYIESFMKENIPEIKVLNLEGTYLQWWDCRELGMSKEELETFMQQEAMLFLDEGYIFGNEGEGFERINLACPRHVLESGMTRLKEAYQKYLNKG